MTGLVTPARFGQLPKLHVYVDETGDRGFSDASRARSPFFAMTALLVPQEDEWQVKLTAGGLRAIVHGAQPQEILKPIHWVEHFKPKKKDRRRQAAQALALIPSAMVIHVIAHKDTVNADAGMRQDKGLFYNYTARLLLERIAFAASGWLGGPRLAIVRLGSVKHMDHRASVSYLDYIRQGAGLTSYQVPWNYISWPPTWEGTQRDGIQLADIHAGLLNCALSGDPQDRACAENLLLVSHQLRRAWDGSLLGYGVKVIGDCSFITSRVWWPEWKTR
ncbi:DUF3800 domain-containing protein [Streptomyces europaeiscabiei]|uniref:DUF3800 domain-containing protein n=1 Tax=Streptomyces europaeiscabiei TaxID=146819 RepID=UPI0029B0A729|nr:DUF3800 domain-containing protein [Streptomyces europaeiscabiei]MDX2528020.1 DUF3800 domain-containing protein [Streptomyces europaeiscabiei]MDX2757856.1 DUF3800 domain-containing protein [Streptomyces europaeiscabiei]